MAVSNRRLAAGALAPERTSVGDVRSGPRRLKPAGSIPAPTQRSRALGLALALALAVLHTWPLATAPGVLSRHDNADAMLNEWIVAWVAHQVPRAPLHLFDANIFYPEPRALTFSEHMVVQGLMGAPVRWLGGSPLLTFNLLLLAGFALSAWSMGLLIVRWTGSRAAGAIAGTLFAFNAHTLTRLPHLQALHLEFLPLVLLALDRLLVERRTRDALLLGVACALQGLTSNYLLVFTALAVGVGVLARANEWRRPGSARLTALVALAAGVAALILAPFLYPYYLTQQEQGLTRSLDEVARYSSTWRDYLATAGRLHYAAWSHRFLEGSTALFPGVIGLALAGAAVAWKPGLKDPRVRMAAAIGAAGFALSFGPALPGYAALYRWLPLLQGVRGAARFGFLALVAVAVLAGFGVAALRDRWGARALWPALVAALVVGVNAEALRAPFVFRPFDGVPRIYQSLRDPSVGAVAEFPFFKPDDVLRNAPYVLSSTAHWKPLANGYSGFVPRSYPAIADALRDFPGDRSHAELQRLGITHVVVHLDAYGSQSGEMASALSAARWLTLVASERDIRVYRLATS